MSILRSFTVIHGIHWNLNLFVFAGYCELPSSGVLYNYANKEVFTTEIIFGALKSPTVDLLAGSEQGGITLSVDSTLEISANENVIESPFQLRSIQLNAANVANVTLMLYGANGYVMGSADVSRPQTHLQFTVEHIVYSLSRDAKSLLLHVTLKC